MCTNAIPTLVCVASLWWAGAAVGQDQAADRMPLQVTAHLPRRVLLTREPILVMLEFDNKSGGPLNIVPPYFDKWGARAWPANELEVAKEGARLENGTGNPKALYAPIENGPEFNGPMLWDRDLPAGGPVPPRRPWSVPAHGSVRVYTDLANWWVFRSPGRYDVALWYRPRAKMLATRLKPGGWEVGVPPGGVWEGDVRIDLGRFEIVHPVGEDREALAEWAEGDTRGEYEWPLCHESDDASERRRALLANHPTSVYAPYAWFYETWYRATHCHPAPLPLDRYFEGFPSDAASGVAAFTAAYPDFALGYQLAVVPSLADVVSHAFWPDAADRVQTLVEALQDADDPKLRDHVAELLANLGVALPEG